MRGTPLSGRSASKDREGEKGVGMEIMVGRYAGFCPGVRRAIRMAEEVLGQERGRVYSLGPIIHNPQVVEALEARGLSILPDDAQKLRHAELEGASVVIRSHGVPPRTSQLLRDRGARLIDAACPTVKKAQRAALRLVGEGYKLFIVGDAEHPEVKAIIGQIDGDAEIIKEAAELREWWYMQERRVRKVGVIAQTTMDLLTFRGLVDGLFNQVPELLSEVRELKIINTLCRNTLARQTEALQLALASDLALVFGGRNSSNTEFLRKICEATGTRTMKMETIDELDPSQLEGAKRIAILGGASTPMEVIEEARLRVLGA